VITRPLDLASRLRAEPRSFDVLFYVNVGALALFFAVFGSRFVLAPGFGAEFRLPQVAGARSGAMPARYHLSVLNSGQIFTEDGLLDWRQLGRWLKAKAVAGDRPSLLIRGSEGVPLATAERITSMAYAAGFGDVIWSAEEPAAQTPLDGGP